MLTPEQRTLRAKIAANSQWASEGDRTARTARMRNASPASLAYWERQLDPDGTLSPEERGRRARSARRAYFQRLALRSSRARSRLREALTEAEEAEAQLAAATPELAAMVSGGDDAT